MRTRGVNDVKRPLTLPNGVHGEGQGRFETVTRVFARLFAKQRSGGALVVLEHGEPVLDVWSGVADNDGTKQWGRNTGAVPYSATKGVTATVIHRLADRGLIDYDAPIAEYWPEFGMYGKSQITVRMMLSHRAGLASLTRIAGAADDILDHRLMEERLASTRPGRLLGVPAYHALTYGWLASGLARAVTGKGMAALFRSEIAEPLGIDGIHLGQPPTGSLTTASGFTGSMELLSGRVVRLAAPYSRALPGPAGAFIRTIYAPGFENLLAGADPAILHTEMPAANGVITARGLATMYGATLDSEFLSPATLRAMTRIQTRQYDRTLYLPMAWRLGYHSISMPGAPRGFGHIGLSGSFGWVDPDSGLSVGFVHNRVPHPRVLLFDQTILAWMLPLIIRAGRGPAVEPAGTQRLAG